MFDNNNTIHRNPNGTIKVSPSVWEESSHPLKSGSNESDDIKVTLITTLNDLLDALGAFSFVQGAGNLARAISDFSRNLELSLGCISVDLLVVASSLQVASEAFASLDRSLAATFARLESHMAYFTADTTLPIAAVPAYTPLPMHNVAPPQSSGGGGFFSHAWHDITNWGSDTYHGTVNGLKSVGAPTWIAVTVGGVAVGGYYVLADAGAVAAAG